MMPMVLPPGSSAGALALWLGMFWSGKLQPATKANFPSGVMTTERTLLTSKGLPGSPEIDADEAETLGCELVAL